jgi:hypothetical protein
MNHKSFIEEFEKEFIWYPLRESNLEVSYNGNTIKFTENGISLYDCNDIEYTLNEMNKEQLIDVVCTLSDLIKIIKTKDL